MAAIISIVYIAPDSMMTRRTTLRLFELDWLPERLFTRQIRNAIRAVPASVVRTDYKLGYLRVLMTLFIRVEEYATSAHFPIAVANTSLEAVANAILTPMIPTETIVTSTPSLVSCVDPTHQTWKSRLELGRSQRKCSAKPCTLGISEREDII